MKSLIKKSIDNALNAGADSCDILINKGESINLSALNGQLEKYNVTKTQDFGIRVIKDNRVGLAYSESFDDDALKFAIKSALENAAFGSVNEHEKITIANSKEFFDETDLTDTSSMEEKIEFALKLESEVKKRDARIEAVPYNGLSSSSAQYLYMNSLGTYSQQSEYYLSGYTSSLIKENNNSSIYYESMMGRKLSDLNLDECIETCLTHSRNWLNAKSVKTGKYDVIFTPEILNSMLLSYFNHFSAKSAIEETNPWREKLNQQVASTQFSLIDSPMYADAFFKHSIDSEGAIKKDLTLIEDGIFKTFFHNTATASFFKTNSTASASRYTRSSLNVGSSNWLIRPGKLSKDEVQDGQYLEIISVMGMGPGTDNITGDFSFGASGYLCQNGKRIQSVKGITVAGNFNRLLTDIRAMGSDLLNNNSKSIFTPMIKFADLSVAGN